MARKVVVGLLAAAVIVAAGLMVGAVDRDAHSGESAATSAPQQTVAELQAVRLAAEDGLLLLGMIGVGILGSLAILLPRREPDSASDQDPGRARTGRLAAMYNQPAGADPEGTWHCGNCGRPNPASRSTCFSCGAGDRR